MNKYARMPSSVLWLSLVVATVTIGFPDPTQAADPDTLTLSLQEVATGLDSPIYVTSAPHDSVRLFIVERGGKVRILKDGSVIARPFLDISDRVATGGERGLLGIAFHPDFPDSPYVYTNYVSRVSNSDTTHLSRFTVSSDPDSADAATELRLLDIFQFASNHNGGMIAFGPDEYLYVGMGDGGGSNDPQETGQDGKRLLGKMLRIDVNGSPFAVPASNPFVSDTSVLDEIWAIGLRNPWRWSFDRVTGDLWIADVGQGQLEEIDFQSSASDGGENYGWSITEGTDCFDPQIGCDFSGISLPFYEYAHGSGRCSITGGFVYRGCAIPDLDGWYFYGDYCTGEIWRLKRNSNGTVDGPVMLFEVANFQLVSFGEDYYGALYVILMNDGRILKLVHDGAVADFCSADTDCCNGSTGNINCDQSGGVDISDLTAIVNHLFVTFEPLCCSAQANTNGDAECAIDISDLTALVNHLFVTFEPLAACLPECG
ncbi:MAG: PQQ-dependent sugar dehydrogenase [candidate division Zixibacteria bacterium]